MQIKNRQQLLLILAGVTIGLLVADSVIITPLTKSWQKRSDSIIAKRKEVREGEELLNRAEVLKNRWVDMRANALPSNNKSLAEQQVLGAFDKWSQDAGISVNSLTPQWKKDNDDHQTLECRMDASGTVGTLAKFLYNLERDPMALRVDSVEITSRDKTGHNLSLALQVSGLVLSKTEEKR